MEQRSTEGLESVLVKATFVNDREEAGQVLDQHQHAQIILVPVKGNQSEPEKPVHQLQITTSTTNPKVIPNDKLNNISDFQIIFCRHQNKLACHLLHFININCVMVLSVMLSLAC